MIKAISYEDIIKELAKFLDTYSGLSPERIQNADSIRGAELTELISTTEQYPPVLSRSFMIFELLEDQDGDNFITKGAEEGDMMTIQSYNFHLMIYGNQSPSDAQKISALFKQENNALMLRDSGIFIRGVSPIEAINEFINNTYVLRRDLIIHLEVRYEFEGIGKTDGYFEESQNVNIIVKQLSDEN